MQLKGLVSGRLKNSTPPPRDNFRSGKISNIRAGGGFFFLDNETFACYIIPMTIKDRIWTCTFAYNPNREYIRATTEAHANRVANHMARTFGWGHHGALRVAVGDCEAEEFPGAFDYRGVVPVDGNAVSP